MSGVDSLGAELEHLRPRLLERIRLMMGEQARAVAESGDFFQELCAEALRDRSRMPDGEGARLRWLTAIARNNVRDEVRRRRELAFSHLSEAVGTPSAGSGSPSRAAVRDEHAHALAEALETLREDQRRVIELRELDGLPFEDVGAVLGRSAEAARKLHMRALLQLGRTLGARPG